MVVLDQTHIDVLPDVPDQWLSDAMQHHSAADTDLALKDKIIAYAWMPNCVIHGVVTEQARREALRRNINFVGRISPQLYRDLVRRFLGKDLVREATFGLASRLPWASARRRLTIGQAILLSLGLVIAGLAGSLDTETTLLGLCLFSSAFFVMVIALRCLCLLPLPNGQGTVAPLVVDADLPIYTVLVPVFREVAVLNQLVHALSVLNYPAEKLDIKLILEEEDRPMHAALHKLRLPEHFEIIIVPKGKPQTKPRALNYALHFARGSLLTIYDSRGHSAAQSVAPCSRLLFQSAIQSGVPTSTARVLQSE